MNLLSTVIISLITFLNFSSQQEKSIVGMWDAVETGKSIHDTLVLRKISRDSLFMANFFALDIQKNGHFDRLIIEPGISDAGTNVKKKSGNWNLLNDQNILFSIPILGKNKNYRIVEFSKRKLILVKNE